MNDYPGFLMRVIFLWLCFLCIPLAGVAVSRELMLDHLCSIKQVLEASYGPFEWKKQKLGWDIDVEYAKARAQIAEKQDCSIRDFQDILYRFMRSFQDYHVNIFFYSSERSSLPFTICGVDGRYFITWINASQLPSEAYDIRVGDELLELDERPIREIIDEIKKENYLQGGSATVEAEAEGIFSERHRRYGHRVPYGPCVVSVRSKETGEVNAFQLLWDHRGEVIRSSKGDRCGEDWTLEGTKFPIAMMAHPRYSGKAIDGEGADPRSIGVRNSFLPRLGNVLWESPEECPFFAYIGEDPRGCRIGFVRIASYSGGEEEVKAFGEIIQRFQEETDLLIIDQQNNGGGYQFYYDALLSMLTRCPLVTPKERVRLTQQDLAEAYQQLWLLDGIGSTEDAQELYGESLLGTPVTYQMAMFFRDYFQFVVRQWGEGKRLTDLCHQYGMDYINPHRKIRYTKPIIVLMNCLSFSAADIVPAVLQDNRRAILFGEVTAGAGGAVSLVKIPNSLGIAGFSYTTTLLERVGQGPMENVGVQPDVSCSLTVSDLQNGYCDYMRELQRTIDVVMDGGETAGP